MHCIHDLPPELNPDRISKGMNKGSCDRNCNCNCNCKDDDDDDDDEGRQWQSLPVDVEFHPDP